MQKPFCLQTQVISCIVATLDRFDLNKKLRVPIAFFSRKLCKAQFKYAIFEKEILATHKSIKFGRYTRMFNGRHFTILCDNQAVVQSLTKKSSENFQQVFSANCNRLLNLVLIINSWKGLKILLLTRSLAQRWQNYYCRLQGLQKNYGS